MEWVLLSIIIIFSFGLIRYLFFKKHRNYLDSWHKDFHKTYNDPRKQIIAHGLLASSGHNTQPWKFVLGLDQDSFDMYIDRCHLTEYVDPDHRQLFISQGTCLKNMEIAAHVLGYDLDIQFNFSDDWHIYQRLAIITIKKTIAKKHMFYEHMFKPDTNRGVYKENKLTEHMKKTIEALNTYEGVTLSLLDDKEQVTHIGHLALEAAFIEARNQDVMDETCTLFKNNESSKNTHPYGFSLEGQGLPAFMIWLIQILMKFFPSFNHPDQTKKAFLNGTKTAIDHTYTFIMIHCEDLSKEQLISVGMLYQELILQLHELELVIQPLSQAIEVYDEMKQVYDKIHKAYGNEMHIAMLARLGYPSKPSKHTMRFKPEKVIEEVNS